jgi:hypothetical protein
MRGWVLLSVLVLGCGSEPRTPATVRGRVLFDGRPLAGGTVVFVPDGARGPAAKPAIATIDSRGLFRLNAEGSPYIVAGWYRVALADAGLPETWAVFPPALRRPDRSGLEREVKPGKDNVFEFQIERN